MIRKMIRSWITNPDHPEECTFKVLMAWKSFCDNNSGSSIKLWSCIVSMITGQFYAKLVGQALQPVFLKCFEPPCATTSWNGQSFLKRPLIKTPKFSFQGPIVRTSHNWFKPPEALFGMTFDNFPSFFTSCKRPLYALCDLYVCCMCYAT